jgi:hypothetical protein
MQNEYLIEMRQQGRFVKVTAIDSQTGAEASIIGDPLAGEDALKKLAIRKLHYVMRKNHS